MPERARSQLVAILFGLAILAFAAVGFATLLAPP
jgi:hypothetical protein